MKTNYEKANQITQGEWQTLASHLFQIGGKWCHSLECTTRVDYRNEGCTLVHFDSVVTFDWSHHGDDPQKPKAKGYRRTDTLVLHWMRLPRIDQVSISLEAFDYMVELKLIEP